jgi:CRISPR-associated endonuclease/helicase Cas3
MQSSREFFAQHFPVLSGHANPFAWQERLFLQICANDIPEVVCIPTGCGKTSAIPIWLLALAHGAPVPRRLVWVVNRRVVVDQATYEATAVAERLKGEPGLAKVRAGLARLQTWPNQPPLAISTLRGQFADNAEWRDDPARAAIITGTVDMIGSRLVFSGYGRGFRSRPLHAGLLGQDVLLAHDEAHLEPAFQQLIESIRDEQRRSGDCRPLRTMELTATSRAAVRGFTLTSDEMAEDEIAARVNARKGILLHPVASQKEVAAEVAARALDFRDSGAAVLVFLRRLADVETVFRAIEKAGCAAQKLTGTMRGLERDALVADNDILKRFFRRGGKAGTVYLVSTSAGEVGVDLSADHAVCDLTPIDSMAQRLGRVNRFGKADARVEVVHHPTPEKATPFDEKCDHTLWLLRELPMREDGRLEASPSALDGLDAARRGDAFSPIPEILPTSDILFDRWALTTIRRPLPGRPPVADWLHGVEDGEIPQTYVAWRDEVQRLANRDGYDREELLDDFPLKPHELLRDSSARVVEQMEKIAERAPNASLWIVAPDGIRVTTLGTFVLGDKKKAALGIGNCTLLLGPNAGGLDHKGFLSGDTPAANGIEYDVSERWIDENGSLRRARRWDEEVPPGMRLVRTVDVSLGQEDDEDEEPAERYWKWYVRPRAADDDGSQSATKEQLLQSHCDRAEDYAQRLATALNLNDAEAEALRLAAQLHDRGKDRAVWQTSIRNAEYPKVKLAKSGSKRRPIMASRYRHEFGSMLEMGAEASDLALHIVAAHHGRARPHFPDDEVLDPNYPEGALETAAKEVPARFIRLQKQHGRWGLAYLESLLRVVDAWASRDDATREAKA